ncbi:hypothetical protein BDZ97DRAFT_1752594 [Flammula alnicola]|nr:hypothetical protein BDZ97DRAFT_1752594 [Flammula alnicola]
MSQWALSVNGFAPRKDYRVVPSAITSVGFRVDSTDPRLQYQGDWEAFGTANLTWTGGSIFLDFSGVSLTLYGLSTSSALRINETILSGIGQVEYPCQYFIDGISPVDCGPPEGPRAITLADNEILVQTNLLPLGQHNITVDFSPGQPLTVDYLIIQTGRPSIARHSEDVNIVAIVGGVLGSMVVIILLIFFVLHRSRCPKRRGHNIQASEDVLSGLRTHVEPLRDILNDKTCALNSSRQHHGQPPVQNVITPFLDPQLEKLAVSNSLSSRTASSPQSHLRLLAGASSIQNIIDPFIDPDAQEKSAVPNSDLSSVTASSPRLYIHLRAGGSSIQNIIEPFMDPQDKKSTDINPNRDPTPSNMNMTQTVTEPPPLESNNDSFDTQINLSADRPYEQQATDCLAHAIHEIGGLVLSSSNNQQSSRIVRHTDSGVRLPQIEESDEVMELPPEYTVE